MTYYEKCKQRSELLTNYVVESNLTFLILKKLREYQSSKNDILNISPAFYGTVIRNSIQSLIVEISKMYNNSNKNDSPRNLLNSMQNNVSQLEARSVSTMQIKSISYGSDVYRMDYDSINDLITFYLNEIEKAEDKINRLTSLRNKYYAHWDRRYLDKLDVLFKSTPLSYDDTEDLLVLNSNICMALYQYFNNSTFYPIINNHDDISKTIHCVEEYERLSDMNDDYE